MRGIAWTGLSQHSKAISDFAHAMRFDPYSVEAHYERAIARVNVGDMHGAKRDLEFCFTFFPDQIKPVAPLILNNMAWALATSPQEDLRDGERAVAWATRACELSEWKQSFYIDTLAAAYAEVGEYACAIAAVNRAMELPDFESECGESARVMLELFRAGKPFRRAKIE
jgi:Flp pilus assembly protein TadD